MAVLLPNAEQRQVTVAPGKGYSVTYFQNEDTTASKITEHLMFICLDEIVGDTQSIGARFLDISKSDSNWYDMWRPICAKDIVNIIPRDFGDVRTELLADLQNCDGEVSNPLTDGTCSGGTPPAKEQTQTLTYA